MLIKQKIILLLFTCFLGIISINVGVQKYIIYPDFVVLEKERIGKNINRIREGIYVSVDELSTVVRDWAYWDDSYQFIDDRNQEFIDSTITGRLETLDFEYIGYFNMEGDSVYSEKRNGFNDVSFENILPAYLFELNNQSKPYNEREIKTIVLIDEILTLISIAYVMDSGQDMDPNGYLVMTNALDAESIKKISDHIQVPFVFDKSNSLRKDTVIDLNKKNTEIYVSLVDDDLQNPLVFKSLYERSIEQKGIHSIYISFIVITVALLVLFLIFYLLFDRLLLNPIKRLTQTAQQICNDNEYTIRIKNKRKDEIGQMALAFNTMIETVEKSMASEVLKRQESDEKSIALEKSISDLHVAQKQLIESEKQASLGSLVSGIAHEINTPLGVCLSYTSFLQDKYIAFIKDYKEGIFTKSNFDKFCNNIDESLEASSVNLRRIAGLVQSFKQISASQNSYDKRSFELHEYVEHICKVMCKKRDLGNNRLVVEGQKDISMNSYPEALTFIFDKFIDNSLLHGFTTREEGTMTISLEKEGENVVINYKDDGNGMTAESVEQIFDPFYTTNKGSGSGLGSHIVYNIVTQTLLGKIYCKSSLGLGVTFTMILPANIEE